MNDNNIEEKNENEKGENKKGENSKGENQNQANQDIENENEEDKIPLFSFEQFIKECDYVLNKRYGIIIGSAGIPGPHSIGPKVAFLREFQKTSIEEESQPFVNEMLSFITQCIVGMNVSKYRAMINGLYPIISIEYLIQTEIESNNNWSIIQNAAQYINICWHGYGKKDDEFVVNTIDTLINNSGLKNATCTFHWIWNYIKALNNIFLKSIENGLYPAVIIESVDEYRAYCQFLLALDSELLRDSMAKQWKLLHCEASCDKEEYDGTDFFNFKQVEKEEEVEKGEQQEKNHEQKEK